MTMPHALGLSYGKAKVEPSCSSHVSLDAVTRTEANPAFKEPHHETHS